MNVFRLSCVFAAVSLCSCVTTEYPSGGGREAYRAPQVSMPRATNRNEQNYLGAVAQVLQRNGYEPAGGGAAEYGLTFSVADGPVNADVTVDLYRGRQAVAHGFGRSGGPRIILQRQRVIQEAFEKAMREFEGELPQAGGGAGPRYGRPQPQYDGGGDPYEDSPY